MLNLTFTDPPDALRWMAKMLEEIAGHDASRIPDAGKNDDVGRRDTERAKVKRLALIVALQERRPVSHVWVLAYHEFSKLTKYHPVSKSIEHGLATHLEAVELYGPKGMSILASILDGFLRKGTEDSVP